MTRENEMQFPRVSPKEGVILHLLDDGTERYGLEMVKLCPRDLKRGTVYVTLDRMEDKGLVESRMVEPESGKQGPKRRVYKITGLGSKIVDAMAVAASIMNGSLGGQYA